TLGVLEEALGAFPGCALIVSHDRWFLDKVATGILAFEGDGRVGFYEGSFSDYLARKRPTAAPVKEAPPKTAAPPPPKARPRKLTFKERIELEGMEASIVDAEKTVSALEPELQDPELYARRAAEVPDKVAALEAAKRQVETLYARWQELEAVEA